MGCHDISMVLTSLRLGKPDFWWPRLTHLAPWIESTTTWPNFPKSKITCEIWFWGWELVRIIMIFFSSCCWKKIHCNLKSGQNRNQQRGSRWNRQTYCSLEFSLRDLARPLHLQPYMSKISISNRFKQKILQTCCAWTWEELFDINNSGLVDFIPLLWDV